MKNVLVMVGTGSGLFVATVFGMLGVQGRLNHEGTKGIPLVSALFPAPPEDPSTDDAAHGADQPTDGPTPRTDKPGDSSAPPLTKFGAQHDGLGNEARLPIRKGKSVRGENDEPGGDQASAPARENGAGAAPPSPGKPDGEAKPLAPPATEWQRQAEALLGQGKYRPGALFSFPTLDSGITAAELDESLRKAKDALARVERKQAALDALEAELQARQRDIEDRQSAISAQMIRVNQEREKLDRRILEFESQVLLVKRDDLKGLKEYARTLASFEPEKASAYVLEEWKTPEGQSRIIKVLAVMSPDSADRILAQMENGTVKDVLTMRLKVIAEPADK